MKNKNKVARLIIMGGKFLTYFVPYPSKLHQMQPITSNTYIVILTAIHARYGLAYYSPSENNIKKINRKLWLVVGG